MNIGQTVYGIDGKNRKVYEAQVVGSNIGESGYLIHTLINSNNQQKMCEKAFVHETKELAEKALAEYIPLMDEMEKLNKEVTAKLDEMRIKLLGEPDKQDLLDRITEGKKPKPIPMAGANNVKRVK